MPRLEEATMGCLTCRCASADPCRFVLLFGRETHDAATTAMYLVLCLEAFEPILCQDVYPINR